MRVRATIFAVEKQEVLHILCVCVCVCVCVFVTLGIQHATRVRHIFIHCLSASNIFLHVFSQTARFSGKKLLNIKYVFRFSLQLPSEIFLISRRIQRGIIITARRYACKVPVNLVRFEWKLNFMNRFSTQISNFVKITLVAAELFHVER
jgi:hypothetical protein